MKANIKSPAPHPVLTPEVSWKFPMNCKKGKDNVKHFIIINYVVRIYIHICEYVLEVK